MGNQKGITTIEVIICFVLVVIMTVSMYATVSSFNEKRILENAKQDIYTYKNVLTKTIQDDFIKIGLTHAQYTKTQEGEKEIHTLICDLRDGSKRRLLIEKRNAQSDYYVTGSTSADDYYMISYGPMDPSGTSWDDIEYPLPDLGSTMNSYDHESFDFSIDSVKIAISAENVLSIFVEFYYPDIVNQLGMHIVCPINYVATGSDGTSSWNF